MAWASPASRLPPACSGISGTRSLHLAPRSAARGPRPAVAINIDGWLALPDARFSTVDPGGNYYRRGLRLDEMFERRILPLKTTRSVATEYRRHRYESSTWTSSCWTESFS